MKNEDKAKALRVKVVIAGGVAFIEHKDAGVVVDLWDIDSKEGEIYPADKRIVDSLWVDEGGAA